MSYHLTLVRLVVQSYPPLGNPMDYCKPGFPLLHYLPEFAQTHVHWVSDAIQPSHPVSPPSHSAYNLSQHQGLFSELALCIRWPKYWSFSFSISPSQEYSGWIDWFGLFAVQGTPKHLLDSCFKSKFESISYLALILLYDPTVTSIHDDWKNHSFDYMDLYQQSDVSAF